MEYKFNEKEMKHVIYDIINGVSRETGIRINAYPVTISDYYYKYLKQQKFSLVKKIVKMTVPITGCLAYNDLNGNTVYFLDNINKVCDSFDKCVYSIVMSSFHEARHSIQQTFDKYSYEGFFCDVDNQVISKLVGRDDYNVNHDKFFVEIDANNYGIYKAEEFLKNKYPDVYRRFSNELDKRKRKYKADYISFDPVNEVDRLIKSLNTMEIPFEKNISGRKSDVLDIFLDRSFRFKRVKDIIRDKRLYQLDERIVFSFFASKSFLDNVDLEKLDNDELYVVGESLDRMNNYYKNQADNLIELGYKDRLIKVKENMEDGNKLHNIVKKILDKRYQYIRDEDEMFKHRDDVGLYLDKAKKTMDKRYRRGFIIFDLFYVISLFISIIVIIYLIVRMV